MRRARRGVTLTELLTVVALITILASFVSPVLGRARQRAVQTSCANNLREIYQALQLYANSNYGRLPRCYDTPHSSIETTERSPIETTWWYRKVAEIIYPGENMLDMPTSRFRPDRCVLRCPASPDHYEQARLQSGFVPHVESGVDTTAKDRVFDNNYGYNNFGFHYANSSSDAIPDPLGLDPFEPGIGALYHGSGPIVGYYRTTNTTYSHIGGIADIPRSANTVLMMDYIKADIAPDDPLRSGSTVYRDRDYGYRFRHGGPSPASALIERPIGRANVMFVAGHVVSYTPRDFMMTEGLEGTAADPEPKDIHFAVFRRDP